MKAVVFGGAGVMGSYAVQRLSKEADVIVADLNEERGKKVASQYGGEFKKVDVTDEESMKKCLKEADVAINCVGPFYKFAPFVIKACINEGINYVDICDDYDITLKLINEFDGMAKEKGITCIVGLGASPGITNVVASYASNKLDEIDEIKIYVTRGIKEEAGGAIPYHMLHCWIGEVPVYENGEFKKAKGLRDGKEYVEFPEPFGNATVYYFGHPETVTLPRYIKVRNVCCKGTFFPSIFRELLLNLEQIGLLSDKEFEIKGINLSPIDFLATFISSKVKELSNLPNIPEGGAVIVKVKGKRNGKYICYKFSGTARMKEATATSAAIASIMLARNEISSPGVKAPEACVPAKEFINKLLKENIFTSSYMAVEKEIEELED